MIVRWSLNDLQVSFTSEQKMYFLPIKKCTYPLAVEHLSKENYNWKIPRFSQRSIKIICKSQIRFHVINHICGILRKNKLNEPKYTLAIVEDIVSNIRRKYQTWKIEWVKVEIIVQNSCIYNIID